MKCKWIIRAQNAGVRVRTSDESSGAARHGQRVLSIVEQRLQAGRALYVVLRHGLAAPGSGSSPEGVPDLQENERLKEGLR